MPLARMLLATVVVLVVTWPARSNTVLFPASVQVDCAEVRCNASTDPKVYITQRLQRGTPVTVIEKVAGGWLKIDPPEGSFSWIPTQGLRKADSVPGVWIVTSDKPVRVLAGSYVKLDKPDFIGTSLSRGAQVIALARPQTWDDGNEWLRIMTPPGEYRYIREQDVMALPASNTVAHPGTTAAASTGRTLPPIGSPSSGENVVRVPAPAPTPIADPLLQQADQLERGGDRIGAARLYDQLGNKYSASNHEAAVQYFNRAAWLRSMASPAVPAPVTEADKLYQQARQYEQAGNRAEAVRCYNQLGDLFRDSDYTLAQRYYNHAAWLRQNSATPRPTSSAGGTTAPATTSGASPQPVPAVPVRAVSVQMIGPGILARSAYPIDGRPTYVLDSPQAQVIAYLMPQPGVDLDHYLGQNVEVLGQIVPRSDVAAQVMSVAKVRPLTGP